VNTTQVSKTNDLQIQLASKHMQYTTYKKPAAQFGSGGIWGYVTYKLHMYLRRMSDVKSLQKRKLVNFIENIILVTILYQ